MGFTETFDNTVPADTQLANLLGQDIRNFKNDIQQRVAAGSGLSTALPALAADAQPTNWKGFIFFATDNGHVYQFSGSAWVDITASFFPASTPSSFFNASCATGIIIPASLLTVGATAECYASVIQPPGAAGCEWQSPFIGGLPQPIPPNGGGSQLNWTAFCKIFFSAVGAAGQSSGYYIGADGNLGDAASPFSFQAGLVNTTVATAIKMQLGAGCTAGPIRVKIS